MNQYDSAAQPYSRFIHDDPVRRHVLYPFVVKQLGWIRDKHILDVGCGEGTFARMLALRGARVVGYDSSSKQIENGQTREQRHPLGISYFVSDPQKFEDNGLFDSAVSIMVLPYAPSTRYLTVFFSSTFRVLKKGGKFISVVMNPSFSRFAEICYGRRYVLLKKRKVRVEFFDNNSNALLCSAVINKNFSRVDYEKSAQRGGFSSVVWKKLEPDTEGREKFGESFWKDYLAEPLHYGFVAKK